MRKIVSVLCCGCVLCLLVVVAVGILEAAGTRATDLLAQVVRAIIGP